MNDIRTVTSTTVRNRLRVRFIAFCAEHPAWVIDRERLHGGWRYVARARHPETEPQYAEAVSLEKLGSKLQAIDLPIVNRHVPSSARVYDYLLGGKDNFQADQNLAEMIIAIEPRTPGNARANKEFVDRAVTWVAGQGVSQFIDIGAGIPTVPRDVDGKPSATWRPTHTAAQAVHPHARVVYVDYDPVVLTHCRALLTRNTDYVEVIAGDLRTPGALWSSSGIRKFLNLNKPVCLITALVYHFIPPDQAREVAAEYTRLLPAGSYVITSTGHGDQKVGEQVSAVCSIPGGPPFYNHTRGQIGGLFDGLELQGPGLVNAARWRPGWGDAPSSAADGIIVLAGVGKKP